MKLYAAAFGPTFVVMDYNANLHRAVFADDYVKSEGIASMAQPACSPDLNHIENFGILSAVLYFYVSHRQPLLVS